MDSPGASPLSEHSDDEFPEQDDVYQGAYTGSGDGRVSPSQSSARPTKRQKTMPNPAFEFMPPAPPADEDVSSDTEGSVPGSPHLVATAPGDEDDFGVHGNKGEQISFCHWEGCDKGETGNMDNLVQHLHDEHIHARQKKYSCEWADCSRKGIPHASGYALRAHMRSHTREKPFYCTLPECDRSFTRSDALAKHMRTVHETEALRPSDPVPKHHSSNPTNKSQKLRLTFKAASGGSTANSDGKSSIPASPLAGPSHTSNDTRDEDYENANMIYVPASSSTVPKTNGYSGPGAHEELVKQFPSDIHFTPEELDLPPDKLYKLLKMQFTWANEDAEQLRREIAELEKRRRKEWTEKELTLARAMDGVTAEVEAMIVAHESGNGTAVGKVGKSGETQKTGDSDAVPNAA